MRLGGFDAEGDMLGYFIDADGRLIDHPINRRVIGIDPAELGAIPNVILAAGGQHKVKVIAAALKTGLVDALVSDQRTAESVLAAEEEG